MNYDLNKPIAVFLGPSLDRFDASLRLAANYYPPARLGDVYRLLGSGVRIIVLIDGVFHQTAPVWQRELLEALDNDIIVIGASSMGALRAAELYPFGMIGFGTIFEWYRTGFIEGDDEVVLVHADESLGFRPFSEPLVNIRYTLGQAVAVQCLSPEQGADLIEYARQTYYVDRSYDSLLKSPLVRQWSPATQEQLEQFIRHHAVNLKKQDAIGALLFCASLAAQSLSRVTQFSSLKDWGGYYNSTRYHHRGFLHPGGGLVNGEMLLNEVLKEAGLVKPLRPVLVKNYFLLLWAKQNKIRVPAGYLESYRMAWARTYCPGDNSRWLRANGLTPREFQAALAERALLTWLVEQGPAYFGLDFEVYKQLVNALTGVIPAGETQPAPADRKSGPADLSLGVLKQAAEICYLAAWARENGVTCPAASIEEFRAEWENFHLPGPRPAWLKAVNIPEPVYLATLAEWAGCDWLIKKEPVYFGYPTWSFEVALLRELQITGQAAPIVGRF